MSHLKATVKIIFIPYRRYHGVNVHLRCGAEQIEQCHQDWQRHVELRVVTGNLEKIKFYALKKKMKFQINMGC